VDATYRDAFVVSSPNHPLFGPDAASVAGADLIVDDGRLLVTPGRRLPGVSRHQANLAVDWRVAPRLRTGIDLEYRDGVYLRGDEINVLGRTHSYVLSNLHGEYRVSGQAALFMRVENLFDIHYETFGVLGDPGEVFSSFEDRRFFSAGPPRGLWLGVRVRL
jgi:outer membrane receptor protein involved in Fe transport